MKKVVVCFLMLFLFFTSLYYASCFYREKEKLKTSIIPSLKNDYFTNLVHQANAYKNADKYIELRSEEDLNGKQGKGSEKKELLDIPILSQFPLYPNGCESVSATMFLNYYGVDISVNDFISKYLPMQNVFEKNGVRYGPNPSLVYAGDPRDVYRGWGAFAPVIESSLSEVLKEKNLKVVSRVGTNLASLVTQLPAIIWVGMDYQEVTDTYMWFNEEETEVYTYPKNSHTVLLVGYKDSFFLNDPLHPEEVVKVKRDVLEKSYDSLGRQAITACDKEDSSSWNGYYYGGLK